MINYLCFICILLLGFESFERANTCNFPDFSNALRFELRMTCFDIIHMDPHKAAAWKAISQSRRELCHK